MARVLIVVLLALSITACQRIQRPFAGENKAPSDTPQYSVKANPNGGVKEVK